MSEATETAPANADRTPSTDPVAAPSEPAPVPSAMGSAAPAEDALGKETRAAVEPVAANDAVPEPVLLTPARPTGARDRAVSLGRSLSRHKRAAAAAALALAALGLGMGTDRLVLRATGASTSRLDAILADLRQNEEDVGRLRSELHALKVSTDATRSTRGELAAKQAQLSERVERSAQETAARLAKLGDQLDRIEKGARVTSQTERLDRVEKQAALPVATTPPQPGAQNSVVPPAPPARQSAALDKVTTTGSIPDAKPDPRKMPLDGYVLRDLEDGVALVESRSGRLFEVAAGGTLPGVGRVDAIERRGRHWVVVTARGFIADR